jgi:preprotein translocase subunit YajC
VRWVIIAFIHVVGVTIVVAIVVALIVVIAVVLSITFFICWRKSHKQVTLHNDVMKDGLQAGRLDDQ